MMRLGTALLLLAAIAWARDCPFCEKPMVAVPVQDAVHHFCRACSGTVYANPDGSATASVRVRGTRLTFALPAQGTLARGPWDVVSMGDLEPETTVSREAGPVAPGHPVTPPAHPVARPAHPVDRPGHPVNLPDHPVSLPDHPVERPAHPVERPAQAVERPSHSVTIPSHAVRRPAPAVQRPSHAVQRPGHPVSRPGHPVSRPGRVQAPALPASASADRPALLLAPREYSPPVRRAPPRRYGAG